MAYSDKKPGFSKKPSKKFGKSNFKKKSFDRYRDDNKSSENKAYSDKKSYSSKKYSEDFEKTDKKKSFDRYSNDDKSSQKKSYSDKKKYSSKKYSEDFEKTDKKKSFDRYSDDDKSSEKKSYSDKKSYSSKKYSEDSEKTDKRKSFDRYRDNDKPYEKKSKDFKKTDKKKSFERYRDEKRPSDIKFTEANKPFKKKFDSKRGDSFRKRRTSDSNISSRQNNNGDIRLNKYISNAGICSRREADELIASGAVSVNGQIITEMGYKVKSTDIIKYGGQTLKKEKMVYVILNKPKDYISTVDDPEKRKTVMELIKGACRERLYPVGRLDRATTGLLLLTNDGELTKKLTHPKYGVKKVYYVELDKPLKHTDLDKLTDGIELEDGFMKPDVVSYVGDGSNKKEIGIELHSGRNRIVRRLFEHIGYNVRKLDRVMFGPLTKKDLPRGRWRHLTEAELGMLNMVKTS